MRRRYRAEAFIAYFQSFSNTYAPVDVVQSTTPCSLYPDIVWLAIGTRPDCIGDRERLTSPGYASKRLVWIEYGLQSASDETLRRITCGFDRSSTL